MNQVKITPPEGYEIDKEKSTFELIVFKQVNKKPQWEDFGEVEGYYVHGDCSIGELEIERSRNENRNTLPTKELCEAMLALCQLINWRDKYNEGWQPDWEDKNDKYVIYFAKGKLEIGQSIHYERVLNFKSLSIRDKFAADFEELILTAKPLL